MKKSGRQIDRETAFDLQRNTTQRNVGGATLAGDGSSSFSRKWWCSKRKWLHQNSLKIILIFERASCNNFDFDYIKFAII